MGSQSTKQSSQQSTITINHQLFKNAKITKQGSKRFMTLTIAAQEKQYQKWKTIMQQKSLTKTSISQHLLLPVSHSFSRQGFCGSTGFANITYQYFPYILIQEMQLRKQQQSKFQQAQLWFLLYVLSSAQVEMKRSFGVKIGDVKPENIFLNEDGDIKISCLYSWPGETTNYSKSIELKETYLAPQQVEKLQTGEVENLTSFQSEIFSIGMTVLSTLLLKDCYFLYDLRKPKFNYGKYNQLIDQWRKNNSYSQIFKAIIINLCSIQPQKRLTLEQLWTFLNTYEKFIIKKCKFVIKNAPLKIQTTIKQLRAPQITYQSKFVSEIGSISHQSTVSKKTAVEFLPFSHLSDAKGMQKSMSPIYGKVASPSYMSGINFESKQNTKIVPQNNQVRFNYANGNKTFSTTENIQNKNTIKNSVVVNNKTPDKTQQQKNLQQNHTQSPKKTQQASIEVQTFFSPPQSIVTEQNNQSSNNGDFVYTRRVVNLNTNSLLSQRDIDENQYIQGVRRNVSQQQVDQQ